MGELYNPYPKLPKNIRQIGERDQIVRLYVEDYVNTYLKRLYPTGGQDLRVGLLLGNVEMHDGTPYIFIDGAMEMEDVTEEGEKVVFSELAWKKAYQNLEQMFPKRTVQGWFLCGAPGCQLSPLNYWKQHVQYFQEQNKMMYLNSGLEGDESVYITSEDGFYKLRGHSIYYERNQMMQDYMILRKDVRRVESGSNDKVIRDFRQRMDERKVAVTETRHTIGLLGGLCSVLAIAVLAGGVVMFNNYEKMRDMESVIASVLPQGAKSKTGIKEKSEKQASQIIIEEAAGDVYPTTAAETMSETAPAATGGEGTQAAAPPVETAAAPPTDTPAPTAAAVAAEPETAEKAAEAAAQNQETYIVEDGETLYGICLKLYHSLNQLDEICQLNGLVDQNKIISGQKLLLP